MCQDLRNVKKKSKVGTIVHLLPAVDFGIGVLLSGFPNFFYIFFKGLSLILFLKNPDNGSIYMW